MSKMERALDGVEDAEAGRYDGDEAVAWDRAEDDYCERGTQGCSVRHTRDSDCQTW
jgi:hypothetical protein